MLRPFNHFRKPRLAPRGSIETIYGMIVTQAREPLFYLDRFYLDLLYLELLYLALLYLALGVPDTVSGRFDLPVLQLWMVSRRQRLMIGEIGPVHGPFDHFCEDLDGNLRQMGVGDLAVPRRMQAFGEAFHGRSAAHDLAVSYGREALAWAICTNIANGQDNAFDKDNVRRRDADAALAHRDDGAMVNGAWAFPLAVNRGVKL